MEQQQDEVSIDSSPKEDCSSDKMKPGSYTLARITRMMRYLPGSLVNKEYVSISRPKERNRHKYEYNILYRKHVMEMELTGYLYPTEQDLSLERELPYIDIVSNYKGRGYDPQAYSILKENIVFHINSALITEAVGSIIKSSSISVKDELKIEQYGYNKRSDTPQSMLRARFRVGCMSMAEILSITFIIDDEQKSMLYFKPYIEELMNQVSVVTVLAKPVLLFPRENQPEIRYYLKSIDIHTRKGKSSPI